MTILYLEQPNFPSGFKKLAQVSLRKVGFKLLDIQFTCLTHACLRKRTKTKWEAVPEKEMQFKKALSDLDPEFVIVNDRAALAYITGKYTSLALCRGSIYVYTLLSGKTVPCLVINELRLTKFNKFASWILLNDLKKAKRWADGKLVNAIGFSYTVCDSKEKLNEFKLFANNSIAIAIDIETSINHISCSGYCCLHSDGRIHTYIVPFIDSTKPGGCYWNTEEDETYAWLIIREVNANNAYKIMQNGSYDSMYFLSFRAPLRNYIADTFHGFRSIWVELPKRLDFITSLASDVYQYWKDEGKEDAKEDVNKTKIPKTVEGMQNYWRYNALDCHNTLLCWFWLLNKLAHPKLKWALDNYTDEFQQQFGPAISMTIRGLNYNKILHLESIEQLNEDAKENLAKLHVMADDIEFNPKSPLQLQHMLYDVFKLKEYRRKGRTTDEKVLKMIKEQNPLASYFIDTLWDYKKPSNNVSKYGSNLGRNGRILHKACAGVTDTGRYASRGHDFWCGVNIQNVPYVMRTMIEPDPGYILFDIDYAQSDAYYTAHEMQDEKFIATMMGEKDTHCIHAAQFFKKDYDVLYKAHKLKEDWVSHNITGIRSITKRIVYGANYLMAAATLFMTMERKPVIVAAQALGYTDAPSWSDAKLIKLCNAFLTEYFNMYDHLQIGLQDKINEAVSASNIASTAWGFTRLFFGNLATDNKIQRLFAAFFGQGGTAGCINKAIKQIYWKHATQEVFGKKYPGSLEDAGVMLLFQVHDSLIGQVPINQIELIDDVCIAMQNECEIAGKKFTVPVEAEVGLGWGKRLMPYHKGIRYDEIKSNDEKWWRKHND